MSTCEIHTLPFLHSQYTVKLRDVSLQVDFFIVELKSYTDDGNLGVDNGPSTQTEHDLRKHITLLQVRTFTI